MGSVLNNLFVLYVFISPINWIPGVPLATFNLVKLLLFLIITFVVFKRNLSFPSGTLSINGVIVFLLFTLLAIINAFEFDAVYKNIKDIVSPFLAIWIAYNYINFEKYSKFLDLLYKASILISLVCFLSVVSYFTGLFDFKAPEPFPGTFSVDALGGYRTGWSNSLFLFVPFVLFYNQVKRGKSITPFSLFIIGSIIVNQFLSGGRAGFVSSLAAVFLFSFKDFRLALVSIVITLIFNSFLPSEVVSDTFRSSSQYIGRGGSTTNISEYDYYDRLSSYRLTGYSLGWELFTRAPLIGYGFGQSDELTDVFGYSPDVHNVWLKRLVDGGLLLVLPLVYLMRHIHLLIKKANNTFASLNPPLARNRRFFYMSMFIPAIIISMMEPNYLIGSFQGEAFFWLCIGYLLRKAHMPKPTIMFRNLKPQEAIEH